LSFFLIVALSNPVWVAMRDKNIFFLTAHRLRWILWFPNPGYAYSLSSPVFLLFFPVFFPKVWLLPARVDHVRACSCAFSGEILLLYNA